MRALGQFGEQIRWQRSVVGEVESQQRRLFEEPRTQRCRVLRIESVPQLERGEAMRTLCQIDEQLRVPCVAADRDPLVPTAS